MSTRGRLARYTAANAVRAILEESDDSDMEDSDFSAAEEDHISELSDQSDTESVANVSEEATDNAPIGDDRGLVPGTSRGTRGRGRRKGCAPRFHASANAPGRESSDLC